MKAKEHLTDKHAAKAAAKAAQPKKTKPQDVRLEDLATDAGGHIVVAEHAEKAPAQPKEENFDYVPVTAVVAIDSAQVEENAGKIEAGVARAATDLFEAQQRIEAARASGNGRKLQIAEEAERPQIAGAKGYIEKQLSRVGALLTAAATAFLNATLSQPYKTASELKAMLHMLVGRKLLIPTQTWEGDTIRIGYTRYRLGDFGFMPSDVASITAKANQLSLKSDKLEAIRRAEHVNAIGTGSISLAQALGGANGTVVVNVPTEYAMVGPEGDKKERRRSGGVLVLEFGDRYVVPTDGEGGFKHTIDGMIEREARITRDFLKLGEDQLQQRKAGITRSLQDSQRMAYPDARAKADDMVTTWWMIHRTLKTLETEMATAAEYKAMADIAELEPVAFFGLNGHTEEQILGKPCLLQLNGFVREGSLASPFLLAQWEQDPEGTKVLKVLEVPTSLKDTFGEFVDKTQPAKNLRRSSNRLGWFIDKVAWQTEMAASVTADTDNSEE